MNVAVETPKATKQFTVEIVYNGITKPLVVEPEQQVTALLARAIAAFNIGQNPHLLSLYREDGTLVPENESIERAGLKPNQILLLRQNAVKGGGEPLRLPKVLLTKTFEVFRLCGRAECECVVYWTGPAGTTAVDAVEHPDHARSPYNYRVEDSWLTSFGFQLARSQRSVKAQVHTHPGQAFHSQTDNDWPMVSQPGFLSIVIPNFATGAETLDCAWLGSLRNDCSWQRVTPSEVIAFHD